MRSDPARPMPHLFRSLARDARRLRTASAGVAAVEFTMILPFMIILYFGLTEVTPAINIKRKMSLVTRTLADLSARSPTLSKDQLKNIFSASTAIMRPYDGTGKTQMLVTSVAVTAKDGAYTGKVEWSCGWNLKSAPTGEDLKKLNKNDAYTVPAGFANATTQSFIVVRTLFPYTPVIGQTITGTINLKESSPWPIRDAERVTLTGSTCPVQS